MKEHKIEPVMDCIQQQYQENWKSRGDRMDMKRFPKATVNYQPKGRRSMGRPMNRWTENPRAQQATKPKTW
jgi:hypothetical protein